MSDNNFNSKTGLKTRSHTGPGYYNLKIKNKDVKWAPENDQCLMHHRTIQNTDLIVWDKTIGFYKFYYVYPGAIINESIPIESNPNVHEVITGDRPQRVYMDLDGCTNLSHMNEIIDHAIRWFDKHYQLYHMNFELLDSSGFDTETKADKYSGHVVCTTHIFNNSADAKLVMMEMLKALPTHLQYCFDEGMYKSIQNFRMPGSVKNGRVMKIPFGYTRDELLITVGFNHDNVETIDVIQPTKPEYKFDIINSIDHEETMHIVGAAAAYLHGWRYRDTVNNFIRFWREKSVAESHCQCCNADHTSDNSRVLIIRKRGIFLGCFKNGLKNAIFIVPSYDVPNFALTADKITPKKLDTTKPKRTNRKKSAADIINEHLPTIVPVIDLAGHFKFNNHDTYDEPTMREYPMGKRTLYIRANMKIGKTVNLIKTMGNHTKIVIISARRTFTHEIMNKLNSLGFGFVSYQDITGDIDLNKYPRVIVQVQSLHRLLHKISPDLLVLDESESVFGEFISNTMSVKTAEFCVKKMEGLLIRATHVIALDANLDHTTIDLIRKARGSDGEYLVQNTHKNMSNDRIYITFKKACLIDAIIAAIKAGANIVIPTNSLAFAKLARELIAKIIPESQILTLSSETGDAEKADIFADVNKHWLRYRVIIFTPTCGAGISFTQKHFNKVFGYFTTSSTCVESWCQALYRARDISTGEYYICIKADGAPNIPNISAMKAAIRLKNQVYSSLAPAMRYDLIDDNEGNYVRKWAEDFHFELYVHVKLVENQTHSRAINRFIELCMLKGATIIPYDTIAKLDTNDMIRDTNLIIKTADYARTLKVPELSRERLIELNDNKVKQTADDKLALCVLNLKSTYNWRGPLTMDFMNLYADKKVIEVTNNLRDALRYDCMNKSIDYIRLKEVKDNPERSVRSERYLRLKIASDIITRMGFDHFCDQSEKPKCFINCRLEIIWRHLEFSAGLIAIAFPTKAKIKNWNYTNGLKYINGIIDTVFGCTLVYKGHSRNEIIYIKHKIYGPIIAQEIIINRPHIIRGWEPPNVPPIIDDIIIPESGLMM